MTHQHAWTEKTDKYRALVEMASDWIWEVDEQGRYTYSNPQVQTVLGYDPEEILGKTPFDLMSRSEAQRISGTFSALMQERKPIVALENTNIHKDGHEVILESSGHPFFDEEGCFKGYRGMDRDISPRRQAEEALRHSEEKFSKAFQTSPYVGIISRLEDGKFIDINDAFTRILGYSKEEVVGRTTIELGLWVDARNRPIVVRELQSGRSVMGREYAFRRKNGDVMIGLFSTQPIHLKQGLCILSSIDDITERKKAEDELQKNRRFLSDIIEYSGALICVKDLDGRYTLINRKWGEITGAEKDDVLGRTDEELFPGLRGRQFRLNDLEVIKTGTALEFEETLDTRDGKKAFFSIKFPVRNRDGAVEGICGMISEITAMKEAEEEKEKTIESLQKALAEIKTLKGILPICANCKKIRDDRGYWEMVDAYISRHTEAEFSHGICPECMQKLYAKEILPSS